MPFTFNPRSMHEMWRNIDKKKEKFMMKNIKKIMILITVLTFLEFGLNLSYTSDKTQILKINSQNQILSSRNHEPINITGNSELINFPDKEGSGTAEDPYVIKNLIISDYDTENSILIRNTDLFLEIKNCTVKNLIEFLDKGLFIDNSTNIKIDNFNSSNNPIGISIRKSDKISISNSYFSNNSVGIEVAWSKNITISKNTFTKNRGLDMYVGHSSNISVTKNVIDENDEGINNPITLTHLINLNFSENNITWLYNGIIFSRINDSVVSKNNIYAVGSRTGTFKITSSNNNIFFQNTIREGTGILITSSTNNSFSDEIYFSSNYYGIVITNSVDTTFFNCTISETMFSGIYMEDSNNIIIKQNSISNSGEYGIELIESNENQITNNSFCNNALSDINETESENNEIQGNIFECPFDDSNGDSFTIPGFNLPVLIIISAIGIFFLIVKNRKKEKNKII